MLFTYLHVTSTATQTEITKYKQYMETVYGPFLKGPIDSFTFLSNVTMRFVIVLNKRT